ncbi:MAG TPA: TonB-dependent receptor [Vicinamibacterales bacterium]|nr:TonB-dependent receptor [Vicinamibacterales bacterium]
MTAASGAFAQQEREASAERQAGSIRGVVVDTRGGAGVRDVAVRLQSDARRVTTDASGRFAIDAVPPGEQELYVSAVDFLLVKRKVTVPAGGVVDITIALTEGAGTYTETIDVSGISPAAPRREPAVPAEQTIGGIALQQLRGVMANDPLRAVQVLPAVAAGDDLRSDFAVRGASVQQTTFTFEGIATPFLVHTVQQVRGGGSVAMVNGDVLDEMTLLNGSYPNRFGNRIGPELDFRMREGSRDRVQSHLSISAIDASGVVDGPIGAGDGVKRGSWLVAVRKSYLDLLVRNLYPEDDISFGFADTQAKLVYDVTPANQVQFAVTAGRSQIDRDPAELASPGSLREGDNRSAVTVATWRSIVSPRVTLTQRFGVVQNAFENSSRDDDFVQTGHSHDILYRSDAAFAPRPGLLAEGGGELRWTAADVKSQTGLRGVLFDVFDGSGLNASAWAQVRAVAAGGASIAPGLRVDSQSLTHETYVSPWVNALWPLTPRVSLRAGGGVYRQAPEFDEVLGVNGGALPSSRAYHVDAGVEGLVGSSARWQVTAYDREDRDLPRLPGIESRASAAGAFVNGSRNGGYVNALDGYARGVELSVQRQTPNGLSGWVSYALGFNRYHDGLSGESFWGDFDQRHTVNVYGNYRVNDRYSVGARYRYGSNFPVTGYWRTSGGDYFLGTERNAVRVPYYSRLDARANRTFTWERKRLTLFLEAINVLNRENVRYGGPSIDRRTLHATNVFETMLPLIPSVGVLLEF